ncbi:hypothetical protein F5Y10DRAFT_262961 [Nemania abortiva]|nr:hypothetical protein F5Y10DRAFT_262961 [Nemania abortiva]
MAHHENYTTPTIIPGVTYELPLDDLQPTTTNVGNAAAINTAGNANNTGPGNTGTANPAATGWAHRFCRTWPFHVFPAFNPQARLATASVPQYGTVAGGPVLQRRGHNWNRLVGWITNPRRGRILRVLMLIYLFISAVLLAGVVALIVLALAKH